MVPNKTEENCESEARVDVVRPEELVKHSQVLGSDIWRIEDRVVMCELVNVLVVC